jgi:hypothetical protein
MVDSATHKPLKVSFDAATGPYIWVSVAQLDRLRQVLVQHDIRHWVDNYPVSVDGEPVSWKDRCLSFVKKYGKAAKVVAGAVLNVVALGSGALVNLVCDKASDIAQDHWEQSLLQATQNNTEELQRLGQLFELLNGDLAKLCDKAAAFADQPDDLPDIISRALAADRDSGWGWTALQELLHGAAQVVRAT